MKISNKKNIEDIVALTPMQEGMLFHYLQDPANGLYHEQLCLDVSGIIDPCRFEQAWNGVVEANPMLRTFFRWEKLNQPAQAVLKEYRLQPEYHDLSPVEDGGDIERRLEEIKRSDRARGFNLREVPFRVILCKTRRDRHLVIVSNHHILFDGWSTGIILEEFFRLYRALETGAPKPGFPVKPHFKEFVRWHRQQDSHRREEYWRDHLAGRDGKTEMPLVRKKPLPMGDPGDIQKVTITLGKNIQEKIENLVKVRRTTLAAFFYTSWGILLQRYCDTGDVVFGTTVSGRSAPIKGIEKMVGLFINTVPLRLKNEKDGETAAVLLDRVNRALSAREPFENTPLVDIQRVSGLKRGEELFDSIVVLENYPLDQRLEETGRSLQLESYSIHESTNYDITVGISAFGETLIDLIYFSATYDRETVKRLADHFKGIVESTADDPGRGIHALEFLSPGEKHRLLEVFNDTLSNYPQEKTIHGLFEEQVERFGDRCSVVSGRSQLTYRELNRKANRLAHGLKAKSVGPGSVVAIMVERSIEMVIGILGILKAGGAYLPIDPGYPEKRISGMLKSAAASVVLTGKTSASGNIGTLPAGKSVSEVLALESLVMQASEDYPENPEHINGPNDLIYVIFTSGSTGVPKGAGVYHHGFMNLMHWFNTEFQLNPTDRNLLVTSLSFDLTQKNLYSALVTGGTLCVPASNYFEPAALLRDIRENCISWINCTPSMFYKLVEFNGDGKHDLLASLRYVFLGGEPISFAPLVEWLESDACSAEIVNTYGPTECTDICASYRVEEPRRFLTEVVPVGKPVFNARLYVVDKNLQLMPVGVPGELLIGGEGVGGGYIGDDEMTSRKFIGHSFGGGREPELLYRTGDLARWLPDGNILFLGRIDFQVKIRGFRIELGEIENRLLEHPVVREAVVAALERENGENYLCAYVVPEPGSRGNAHTDSFKEHLSGLLPQYMVPGFFTVLESLPLTPTGKIDRKALPRPEAGETESYAPPRDELEEHLVSIWSRILGADVSSIGIDHNFFHMGGHSLNAVALSGRIHKAFDREIPLPELFKIPTIREIARYIRTGEESRFCEIPPVEDGMEYYPLSPAQERLLVLQQMEEAGTVYNIYGFMQLTGKVNREKFRDVFAQLIQRHESFRTSFHTVDGHPVQKVHDTVDFSIEYTNLGPTPYAPGPQSFIRPFDLSRAPLLRVGLAGTGEDNHLLMIDMHHIISDGTSMGVIIKEFMALYSGGSLPAPRVRYRDFVAWFNRRIGEGVLKPSETYWLKQFEDEVPVLDLPLDFPRPRVQSFEGAHLGFSLDYKDVRALRAFARDADTTLYSVLVSLFTVLLSKLGGQEDIVVGTPVAGRQHEGLEDVVGMFINTLVLRNFPSGQKTVMAFAREVGTRAAEAFAHQEYPFEALVENVSVTRDTGRNPLFDVMFALQNFGSPGIRIPDLNLEHYNHDNGIAKFDLVFICEEKGESLDFIVEYCTRLFTEDTVQRFTGFFKRVVTAAIGDRNKEIGNIEIISPGEKHRILDGFNGGGADYPRDKTIHQLFEEQAERFSDQCSVICGRSHITYGELEKRSNRLAQTLQDRGVGPGAIIAIMTEQTVEMVTGIWGILKAGAAYLPIDPGYPQERIDYMLKDSSAKMLLANEDLADPMNFAPTAPVHPFTPDPGQLAYIIYTSGSTGRPKGVMVEHRSLVNLCYWHNDFYRVSDWDRATKYASIGFDASVWEMFPYHIKGASLYIVPEDIKIDTYRLSEFYRRHGITISFLPTQMCQLFMEYDIPSLTRLLAGGDELKLFKQRNYTLYNNYGPTENTVVTTAMAVQDGTGAIPIGKPMANVTVHILDPYGHLQPIGIAGELCLAGAGLARGYLNRPQLTAEKFVDLYRSHRSYRTYKTGDLAKWLPDGNIRFLGRIDQQVKIRGFRIELGEIENRLKDHDGVKHAVVMAREHKNGEKYLCAYIVYREEAVDLKEYLSGILPEYMIPAYFVPLDAVPLSPSGKVDRKKLPEPVTGMSSQFAAPRSQREQALVSIWAEVLDMDESVIGIDDNFFELGGHSLRATRVIGLVNKNLDAGVSLVKFFEKPTIRRLAEVVSEEMTGDYHTVSRAPEQEYYGLSPAQERFFVFQEMHPNSFAYNIAEVLEFSGQLDEDKIESCFRHLVMRHESLRTSFHMVDGRGMQKIHAPAETSFNLEYIDITGDAPDRQAPAHVFRDFVEMPFDLSQAPLFRVRLPKYAGQRFYMGVSMHHIVSDGSSVGIIIRDFLALYSGQDLPEPSLRYRDYVLWKKGRREAAAINWTPPEYPVGEMVNLPVDYTPSSGPDFKGGLVRVMLTGEELAALKHLAGERDVTLYMLLLSLINVFLGKLCNQESIVIGSPIAGRTRPDFEDIVGLFLNTLVLRNTIDTEEPFTGFLERVKRNCLAEFEGQDYQYEMLMEWFAGVEQPVGTSGSHRANPFYNVMFVLQNMEMPDVIIPGVTVKRNVCLPPGAKFDLTVTGEEYENSIRFSFEYATLLFRQETIERYAGYFCNVIRQVLENPVGKISGIHLVTGEERRRILDDLNRTSEFFPWKRTVYGIIEEQACKREASTALVRVTSHVPFRQVTLTYGQLNRQVNRLARLLRRKGVVRGTTVGIMMDRSIEAITGILAVLKAGGTYVPIDPAYPEQRIAGMLERSAAPFVLTSDAAATGILGCEVLAMERLVEEARRESPENPEHIGGPDDLIYIIFTSGSTGVPKGAGVYHHGFMNLLHWFNTDFQLKSSDRNLLVTSLSFDLTQKNLYSPLMVGGVLCIPAFNYFEPAALLREIRENCVSWLNCTPSMFYKLVEFNSATKRDLLTSLRYVFLGGEPISFVTLVDWLESDTCNAQIVNTYGPTECTDICGSYRVKEPRRFLTEVVPVGKPVYNVRLYVVGKELQLLPVGVPGELLIGGEGVGIGYIGDSELTRRKFIRHSFVDGEEPELLYRTGDLVKWREDASETVIEFIGRIDHQVKVRGFRIELGEIESRLLAHPNTVEVLVMARDGLVGDKYLCAYLVPNEMEAYNESQLREYLAAALPDYMVPSFFIAMEKMPLNPNGKVDRKALPEPRDGAITANYTAPRTGTEETLAAIWSEVLNSPRPIGIDDKFFEIGGHSLNATQVIFKIHRTLDVQLKIADLFNNSTIRGLAGVVDEAAKEGCIGIPPVEDKTHYTLSSVQKRMYILQQLAETGTGYNIPYIVRLTGQLDRERLEDAFGILVQRHESLRTSFHMINELPVQRIHDAVGFSIEEIGPMGPIGPIKSIIAGFIRPFDLAQAPLFRVGLAGIEDNTVLLMIDMHHIISDGISSQVFTREFMSIYAGEELPELKLRYRDYVGWQQRPEYARGLEEQERYWLEELSGELPVLNLPTDYQRPPVRSFEGRTIHFEIGAAETEAIRGYAAANGATLYMVLLTSVYILLSRLSGQEDIILGAPVAGRPHAGLDSLIGMFVNTLALRQYPEGSRTFRQFLGELTKRTLTAFDNQDFPLEELVEKVAVNRDTSRNPLFDVVFILQNMETTEAAIPGLVMIPYEYESQTAKFDLSLICTEVGETLACTLEYSTALFKEETVLRYSGYLIRLITGMLESPDRELAGIGLLSEQEKEQLITGFNDTYTDYPRGKTIHEFFEQEAVTSGERCAVVFGQQHISYGELDREANRLAYMLQEKGVGPESIVALKVERSFEMMIGILGILKAGGAYLPIDPRHPQDRIDYMLNDSSAKLLLTSDDITEALPATRSPQPATRQVSATNLAYVIYTSGSTGKPKGTLVTHTNVVRVVKETNYIDITSEDRILQLSNYAFDGSVFDIYGALLNGAKLVMVTAESVGSTVELGRVIVREGVTVFFVTTALFNTLVDLETHCFGSVRNVLFGGETVSVPHSRKALEYMGSGRILHVYGPTETTVFATYHPIDSIPADVATIPIGKPIANTTVYLLDKWLNPVPLMVSGEVYVGGDGVCRGYLNNPELTAEKFIHVTPGTQPQVLYRTGDLARRFPNGDIEFLGRIDQQVKIRGFRIEPGEIESSLSTHPGVQETVVLAKTKPDGEKYLCAYIVTAKSGPEPAALKEFLGQELPDFMIPSYFVHVEKIPLNQNGKVDRRALPEPEWGSGKQYAAPRNPVEVQLVDIWSQLFNIEKVKIGIDDNFFDLGGHSLKATFLKAKIHKALDVNLPLGEIFTNPTIRQLGASIKQMAREEYLSIVPIEEQDYYAVSSAQKRLHFLRQLDETGTGYNIPSIVRLTGHLDRQRLEDVFGKLVQRHESLRTSFHTIDETPVQRIHNTVDFSIEEIGPMGPIGSIKGILADFIRPFDLAQAPLLRVGLVKIGEDEHFLLMDMHHIISDGTSMAIITREFMALFAGETLDPPTIQYKDYSEWQQKDAGLKLAQQQESFWLDQFRGESPVLELPFDHLRPVSRDFAGDSMPVRIDGKVTEGLNNLAGRQDLTLFMLLLAIYNVLLSKLGGQEDIVVGTPVAGRNHDDLGQIVGMFVNTLALRNFPAGVKTFREFLAEVKHLVLTAFDNQAYQYDELVEKVQVNRDTGRNPLFDTMLILQNTDRPEITIPGLTLKPMPLDHNTAKFDLSLICAEVDGELTCDFEYSTSLFNEETIMRFSGYLQRVIRAILENPDIKIADIEIVSPEEKEQLLVTFNDSVSQYPHNKTINQLFEEQAERRSEQCSVVSGQSRLTYGELDRKANALAAALQEKGVESGAIVAIKVDRSLEMMIGILAILKAGAAYLPIAPDTPAEREKYILKDSNAQMLLTADALAGAMNCAPTDSRGEPCVRPNNLAYIIYTSGSTGRPKGVMVEHRAVLNTLFAMDETYPFEESDVYLLKTAYTFDVSVAELFGWFLGGGSLAILEKDGEKDPLMILDAIDTDGVTHLNFVPSMFNVFVESLTSENTGKLARLKYIFLAGEALGSNVVNRFREFNTDVLLENIYGPTEAAIYASNYPLSAWNSGPVPIGKPLPNVKLHILDAYDFLQPIGVAGELHIAGAGLARGYLNRPELTGEKFVDLNRSYGAYRTYKTGDLAKWLPDGNIEFLGRIDHQVKIRGFRIELGEIENRLLENEYIKEAVVVSSAAQSGENYLCAYFTAERKLGVDELRVFLSRQLPEYMIPAYFMQLEEMPLNPSGKTDRKRLPRPEISSGSVYTAPGSNEEKMLAAIWEDILEPDRIGIDDNFFYLGGHSLLAVRLVSKIHKALNVNLTLGKIFENPTIRKLALFIKNNTAKENYISITPVDRQDYYPVSSAQKRLYVLQKMDEQGKGYNLPFTVILEGNADKTVIEKAFMALVHRHESLRTSFHMENGEPVQVVHEAVDFSIETIGPIGPIGPIDSIISGFIRPFDLSHAPLLRVGVAVIEDAKHLLMVDMHHIVSDGTSLGVLVREFMELYGGKSLPAAGIRYKDYAAWQHRAQGSRELKRQEAFWLNEFAGEIPVLDIPFDYVRPAVQEFAGNVFAFEVDKEETRALSALGAEEGATLFMVLLAVFNVLLSKLSGQEDIVVGAPVAGRGHDDLQDIVGMFVNTLALRNFPGADKVFNVFLGEIKTRTLAAFENQAYQYESLVDQVAVTRDTGRNPLFDAVFVLQNVDIPELEIPGLKLKPCHYETRLTKFDITLTGVEHDNGLGLYFEYRTKLFKEETIKRFSRYLKQIVSSVLENPAKRIAGLDMIPEEEKQLLLVEFNDTEADYPQNKTIHGLIEEQAAAFGGRCSVVSGRSHLTYGELDGKANALASVLQEKGVGPGSIAAIMMEQSIEMITGMLAILKSGAAFLPIDPGYPQDRIDYMLKDSNAALFLTSRDIAQEGQGLTGAMNSAPTTPTQLCYIIYTSGSTGRPKGVMVEHRSLVNLCSWHNEFYRVSETDHATKYAGIAFDASVWEIFPYLVVGALLHIVPAEIKLDIHRLNRYYEKHDITISFLPTQVCEQFMEYDNRSLRVLLAGGDKLKSFEPRRYRLYNNYGPTENTVVSTAYRVQEKDANIPIGKPIANTQLYILDPSSSLLRPMGVAGELCISGAGLALGYLNRPQLTAEKFIDFYRSHRSYRTYKTGDLARWLPDGNIQFLGRIDQQVKIRGYRIEPGEIESSLLAHPGVHEAVVLARTKPDGDRYLCAYIAPAAGDMDGTGPLESVVLKEFLSQELPDYMVPPYFVQLERIPLNKSGKVDRRALPEPELGAGTGEEYTAPRTPLEEGMVDVWSGVLSVPRSSIGIDDNFFQMGGHSLKATTLVHRMYKALDVKIELQDVFTHPTIRQLAKKALSGRIQQFEVIVPAEEKEYYDLSFAQRRLWVLCQFEEDSTAYNIPAAFIFTGNLDREALRRAMQELSDRHDSLRTVFRLVEGAPYQVIVPSLEFQLEVFDLRRMDSAAQEEEARKIYRENANLAFDLENGPLFLFKLVRLEDEKYVVIYNIHHIISDGWSQGNISNDIVTLYNSFLTGEGVSPLPPLELQYKDYSCWHNRLIANDRFQKPREYWLEKFGDKPNGIELPLDRPRKAIQTFNGGRVTFTLDREITRQLQALCLRSDATLFMGLLTLLNIFLYRYTGQVDIIIGAPIANRKQPELHPMIGFLVNTLVFRNKVNPALSFEELLQAVKSETLGSYENQDFPFDLLVEGLELDRDMSQSPIFNVMLAHNNTETGDDQLTMKGITVSPYVHTQDFNMSKFDLTFFADEADDRVVIRIEYNSDLFDRSSIEGMAANMLTLTSHVITHSGKPTSSLNILREDERKTVVERFNDTGEPFPALTLQELFEQQAEKHPDRTSVISYEHVGWDSKGGGLHITYGQLNQRANRLARFLLAEYNVKPNDIIGISMDRSIDMIVVIWGIIKSGAGYLAVDPTYPRERVLHVLENSRADLLMADRIRPELYGGYTGEIIEISTRWQEIEKQSQENPPAVNQPTDVLYVNYTSGSTGTPNGAMLSHDCLTNLIRWQNRKTSIDCSLRVLQFTSINFCVSFQEITGTLTSGGQLHLIGDVERQDTGYLVDFLSRNRIQVLFLPFSYLNFLFTQSTRWAGTFKHSLEHIITAGEQLKITAGFKQFLDQSPHLQVHNHYGSTEMHVVTSYTLDASTAGETPIPPAGKPISNVKIFILDEHLNPVPVGVWGELMVVGDTEILGYINNDELTGEKLVHHPEFSKENNIRLYRSGDIGRWLPDGNIELRGRKDFMVKIRGFRIELGEVESKILSLPQVRECVVVPLEDDRGQKNLFAYVSVNDSETGIDALWIKRAIGNELPLYMIPQIIVLDSLPLMPNGKVDRGRLPEPDFAALSDRVIVPPTNEAEEKLVDIWSQLLEAEKEDISIDDNFFDLGGHSLKATTMMTKIHRELGIKIELVEIFKSPTIRDIAGLIEAIRAVAAPDVDDTENEENEEFIL